MFVEYGLVSISLNMCVCICMYLYKHLCIPLYWRPNYWNYQSIPNFIVSSSAVLLLIVCARFMGGASHIDFTIPVLVLWRWFLRKINQLHWLLCDIFVISFSFFFKIWIFFILFIWFFEKKMFGKLWIFLKKLDYLDFFFTLFFLIYIFFLNLD